MKLQKKHSMLFVGIVAAFVAVLLVSNVSASKQFNFFGQSFTVAVMLFPFAYIINDLLAEVYGFHAAKKVIWIGFGLNLFMVLFFQLAIILPSSSFYTHQDAYATILGNTPRLLVASLAGYLVGGTSNAWVLAKMKVMTKGEHLAARVIVSTLVGELLDSLLFLGIAFYGVMPLHVLLYTAVLYALFKVVIEVVMYPVTKAVINKVKTLEGEDVYGV